MKILVLNCGSSSIKYKLFEDEEVLASGYIQKIGVKGSDVKDHIHGIKIMFDEISATKKIKDISEIEAVGHRVVHGGELSKSCIIDKKILGIIDKYSEAAPLHNPPELKGILAVQKHLPKVKNIAVFDTAFHQTMPEHAFAYGLPYRYLKQGIRRYGFHGTSHHYVAVQAAKMLGKRFEELKIVTCHLGAGSSIAAIDKGRSIDTSMGYTPLEGLMMGTRCGDIDPGVLIYLMRKYKIKPEELDNMLNNESGLLGISGHSDFRDVIAEMKKGDKKSKIAFDMFCYRIKKYIGAYAAALDGIDAIVFTGGVGENNAIVRKHAAEIKSFGIKLDDKKNQEVFSFMAAKDQKYKKEGIISRSDSKIKVLVIPTNEELMIAKETEKLVKD